MAQRTDELASWLRLERTPGVGPETARRLLAHFGLPDNIFAAGHDMLSSIAGERSARALLAPVPDQTLALIEKTSAWSQQPGNYVLTLADQEYPRTLLDIADPPLILYVKGHIALLQSAALAVVGSRNATAQGMRNAEHFSQALSDAGLTVVSGLALGIDAAAHRGALRAAGSTLAVIGTGADIVYPARNRELAHDIAENGCIISEYALGTPAISSNFPRRNRIISGLAQGVLVIEAAVQSGSLITARIAAEQGRDVFAIPGSIHSPLSKGCHLLIKQGAKLVESAQDVLEELRHIPMPARIDQPSTPVAAACESALLAALGHDPVAPETLAGRCAMSIAQVQAELLGLELAGSIEMLPGGMARRLTPP